MAVLSSRLFHYLDAIKELKLLYIARGYPPHLVHRWAKDNANKRWQSRLEETAEDTSPLYVLKSSFNPLWEEFDIKSLFCTIKESWLNNKPVVDRCNLEGRCSLHNSATMQHTIPFDMRVAEKERLTASEFKYTIVNNDVLVDTQVPDRSKAPHGAALQQYALERFWDNTPSSAEGSSRKRQASDDGGDSRVSKVKRTTETRSVNYEREAVYSSPVSEPAQALTDLSVSCLSTNPDLPRLQEPDGPYSWSVGWAFSERLGVTFEKKKSFDFMKTSFFNRRMLVSRQRNTNLFDLTSAWRKASNKLQREEDDMFFDALDDIEP
jgi:hypothetical protein